MPKEISQLNVLFIQLRRGQWKQIEQQACFEQYSGLAASQFTFVDAFSQPITPEMAKPYDAVVIGGSAECNVSRREPNNIDDIAELARYCTSNNIPLLGICYGAHLIAYALGGTVEYAPHQKELGTFTIRTREGAKEDALFAGMPEEFNANVGRTDNIIELPIAAIPLASSDIIEHHAFTIDEKPVYAMQFHPELDKEQLLSRLESALEFGGYFDSQEEYEKLTFGVKDTPESASLLKGFFERIVAKQ